METTHQKAIVSFDHNDFRNQNHSKSLVLSLGIQFILPSTETGRLIGSSGLKRLPFFENDCLLTHYENDIERLNKFYSIFDFSMEGQIEKVLDYFSNEKFEKYQPYSWQNDDQFNPSYYIVCANYYPSINVYFVENTFRDVNIENQTYTKRGSKRTFKVGRTERTVDGKEGVFNRNDKKQIEKIFKLETWYRQRIKK